MSVECIHSKVPPQLLSLLKGKDIQIGVIDVASDTIETPEDVAATIETVLKHVAPERVIAGTNCGMAPMQRDIAIAKLDALGRGAALTRQRFG
jgi:5-methyltetrahydropteroyltriglutamate--homocysteine methyltransferase